MRRGFKIHDQAMMHFVTSTVVQWIPVFTKPCYFQVLVDSFNYCIRHKGLLVYGYVLMPTHFHAVIACEAGLSDVMRDLKHHTAKTLLEMLEGAGRSGWMSAFRNAGAQRGMMQLWQSGLHPEEVRTEPFFLQKLEYIHTNPVRSGFVRDPCAWIYSSAAFFEHESPSPIAVALPGEGSTSPADVVTGVQLL